jgi:hypothetical protein
MSGSIEEIKGVATTTIFIPIMAKDLDPNVPTGKV